MDTEYERNAVKAVLFTTRSRKELTELNADRAVTFLRKTIFAEDMLNTRMALKRKLIDAQIDQIDTKIVRLGDVLSETRKKDLVTEKEMLKERAESIKKLQIRDDKNSVKRFNQSRKRLADNLLEENREKRRTRFSKGLWIAKMKS